MRKAEAFKTESLAFAEKVQAVNYYDEKRWFSSAYSTLNARFTIEGGGLSQEAKTNLSHLLFSSINNLESVSANDYDKWFYQLAKKITDQAHKLSFGHAQKLINILMKYHFVYFYSDLHEDWKKSHAWLEPYFSYFHAPIDRIVLKSLTEKYSFKVPPDQFSWTKWQWTEKVLYAELQKSLQKLVTDRAEMSHNNRLYFEMKELWKSAEGKTQNKVLVNKVKRSQGKDGIKNFVEEIVNKINKQGCGVFELNETTGYFSIARVGVRRYKNVVCFVKDEYVASISKYANIEESFFDNPPYNKLKKRSIPPPSLQIRDRSLYPYPVEYDLNEDREVIFHICKKACEAYTL